MTCDKRSDSTLTKVRPTGTSINSRFQGRQDPRVCRGPGMAVIWVVPVILAGGMAFAIVFKKTNLKATSFHRTCSKMLQISHREPTEGRNPGLCSNLPSNLAIFLSMYPKRETDSSVTRHNMA